MKILKRHLFLATALAAGLVFTAPLSVTVAHADEAAKDAIDTTAGGAKIPSIEEARAAMMMPDDPNPVPGQILKPDMQAADASKPSVSSGSGDPTTATGGQAAVGGPMSPGASAGGQNADTPGGSSEGRQPSNTAGTVPPETTGARPADSPADTRPGPIGATGQTMPSTISQRNEILDRVPIMAMPLALTEPERQRIYETVMADKSRQPTPDAESLAPATFLSTEQALNEAQPMPDSLQDIELLRGLQYVKAKDKVLLVRPVSRIVVDAITM